MNKGANYSPDSSSLGAKIRRHRKMQGYTQAYMAEKLDLSVRGYSKLELGETKLSVLRLFDIAEILAVSIHELLLPISENRFSDTRVFDRSDQSQINELKELLQKLLDKNAD